MKKTLALLVFSLTASLSTVTFADDKAELNNYLVQCKLTVETNSKAFTDDYADAWTWLVEKHKQGIIENVYLSNELDVGLNMIVKASDEEALTAIMSDNPFIKNDISTCESHKVGVYLPLAKPEA